MLPFELLHFLIEFLLLNHLNVSVSSCTMSRDGEMKPLKAMYISSDCFE